MKIALLCFSAPLFPLCFSALIYSHLIWVTFTVEDGALKASDEDCAMAVFIWNSRLCPVFEHGTSPIESGDCCGVQILLRLDNMKQNLQVATLQAE